MKSKKIILLVIICFIFSPVGLGSGSAGELVEPDHTLDQRARILVLSAFCAEMEVLKNNATINKTVVINGRTCYVGTLCGNKVVLGLTGISMVNAAMVAQTLIDHFNIKGIVFSGIAGGVSPDLNIGDVVVGTNSTQYQEMLAARYTGRGDEPLDGDESLYDVGRYTIFKDNYGFWFPQPVGVTQKGNDADAEADMSEFASDPDYLAIAAEIVDDVILERCTPSKVCLDNQPKITFGLIVSGQTFVDNANYRMWVCSTFEASAMDMETAAVAHVAYVNKIPLIPFRSLSDLAGGGPGQNQIGIFFELAANNSARVLLAFLTELAARE